MAEKPLIVIIDMTSEMGGVEHSTLHFADKIDTERFRRIVVCPTEGPLVEQCRIKQIPVTIIPLPKLFPTSLQIRNFQFPNPIAWILDVFFFLVAAERHKAFLRDHSAALVVTKGMFPHFYGALAARGTKTKCIIHLQDFIPSHLGGLYVKGFGFFARYFSDAVIVDGTPIQEQLAPYVSNKHLHLVYNGVDISTFTGDKGEAIREEWGLGPDELLIGNVARLTQWKGQDYLIKAFAQVVKKHPHTRLVLVGNALFTGEYFAEHLKQLVVEFDLTDKVIFAGYRWDLPEILSAVDIYAHPSIIKDTSPIAVISAMASGNTIVCSNVRGIAELFEPNVDAMVVEAASVESLSHALIQLVENPTLRHSLGIAAQQKARRHLSVENFAENCQLIVQEVLDD